MQTRFDPFRIPIVIAALLSLLLAGWIGLARMGWGIPSPPVIQHGPLMMGGFFGTLIGMERAVAIQSRHAYVGPALSALGAVMLVAGQPRIAALLLALSSLIFALISGVLTSRHRTLFAAILTFGGALWLAGNIVWVAGSPVYSAVPWWTAFLVVTIAGERLELARLIRITTQARILLAAVLVILLAGLIVGLVESVLGARIVGAAYLALAAWLFRYDIARRTIRSEGLPRFVAICLLGGYFWMGIGGMVGMIAGGAVAGLLYDALIHTILIGFIMSMIFGHAPIILPALLNRMITFSRAMYVPLALLHVSMLLRFASDMFISPVGRQWAGVLNAAAILGYLGMMAYAQFIKAAQ
jgi:hypothetical protein